MYVFAFKTQTNTWAFIVGVFCSINILHSSWRPERTHTEKNVFYWNRDSKSWLSRGGYPQIKNCHVIRERADEIEVFQRGISRRKLTKISIPSWNEEVCSCITPKPDTDPKETWITGEEFNRICSTRKWHKESFEEQKLKAMKKKQVKACLLLSLTAGESKLQSNLEPSHESRI